MDSMPLTDLSKTATRRPQRRSKAPAKQNAFGIGPVVDFPRDATLATLFAAQVSANPDTVALIDGDEAVSYSALDRLVDTIARRLISKRVQPGDVVGVSLERSTLMVAAMLAAMRLGAAYLPLDPSNPAERLRYIAENSRATTILTTEIIATRLGYANALTLDDLDEAEIEAAAPVPVVSTNPLSPAYIAYTSGSTGQPKGVMGTHLATVNRFVWMWRTFPFAPGEVMCQKTAISFVDSVWEIFGPLLAGVPQVIIGNATVRDPAALLATLGTYKVTRLLVVPSLLKTILEAGIDITGSAPHLRFLFASGERLPKTLAQKVLDAAPGVVLVNLYGSSEVAADVTCEIVSVLDTDEVPIGKPIDNSRLYVLDESRKPVPDGEAGELYVGGDVLAGGYLHRPDLTAERFISDPFSETPGALMFATGDRVNWLADGRLMFRGRMDHQVKIRGARVELGEVEANLAALPGVAEAVVVAQPDAEGDTRLVAFVTGRDGAMLDASALRAELGKRLPDYMVPARINALKAMPLNPNGKTDRTALAALPWEPVSEAREKPATEIENELHQIWSRLLGIPSIGVDEDYFALGGHSLMAVKMFAAVKSRLGVDVPIATLLVHPTIRSLGKMLAERIATPSPVAFHSGKLEDSPWDTTAVIHPGPGNDERPLFIVGGIGGNVNNLLELGKAVGKYRPLIGLQTRGVMGHNLHETFEATAADHLANIRRHQPEGPYLIAGYSGGSYAAFEMARQLQVAGERVDFIGVLDMHAPKFAEKVKVPASDRLRREIQSLAEDGIGVFLSRAKLKLRDKLESGWLLNIYGQLRPEYARLRKLSRAWWDLEARYRPGPYKGDLTLFLAQAQGVTTRMMLEVDPEYGWRNYVDGKLNVVPLNGNHFDFIVGPQADVLATRMEAMIAAAKRPVG
ncbi:MAG: amino acid adenylation domain-containing protein [Rhizobiaceae bacterium]|nr:amino acid adenylation domain-containing protein [Rhizobiaceae bacterium]